MTAPISSRQAATTGGRLRITRADHVALRVADYDETIRFYTTKLNFQLEAEWTLGDAVPEVRLAYVRLGAFMIEVIGDGGPEPAPATNDMGAHLSRSGYVHLCLRVEDLDEVLAELRARGVAVFAEPFVVEPIGQRLAMVRDNSGNIIELAQAVAA
jgi:catechol 2,3-dioxygenase-like lactoylglutathione lyase family enzyme